MTRPLLCLLAFAGWSIFLVLCIAAVRTTLVLTGKKRSNEFPSGTPHGGDRYWRLNRAHMNTLENLPLFGAIVLTAAVLHVGNGPSFARLATVVVIARMVQSTAHIASGSSLAVNVRFAAFTTQMVCFVVMLTQILRSTAW